HRPGVYKPNPVMTMANKCPAQSPSHRVSERLQQLQYTDTLQNDFMADYIYYYIQTFLSPVLVLALCLCILKYCCRFCRTDVIDIHTDSDLSINDRVFVIPIDERDEPDYEEETDGPPTYDLACPPPSYTESVMKIYPPSGQEILNTGIDASHGSVEIPPPPYSPSLDLMSQTPSQPSDS
ncbi:hypothetical protein IRJ41_014573, partial [Triplophysa rosa]